LLKWFSGRGAWSEELGNGKKGKQDENTVNL
jgi:hypothetical protein